MARLNISPDLSLPLDAVTETFAILAVRGAGKSNAAVAMAEEMHKAGLPWVAIDPKGDWWGIRSSADGKGPGLPVALFGAPGRRRRNKPDPDVPLEDTAGKLIADLVVDEGISCILDMAGFTEAAKIRFLIDFGTRLFERNEEPLHLFLEECDDYMPQKPFKEQTRLLHIYTKILKQGRSFGIGGTLVSQRSAVVNKNALTQCQTLIALRTTSPQDRAAIEGWVKEKGGQHLDIVESLPSLKDGEAWVWSPEFLGKVERMRFRKRETFDSGATPKVGGKRVQPKTVADIDLGALQERMAETIERSKAEDPKELKKQIAQLRKELRTRPTEKEVETKVETVEVPVFSNGIVDRLDSTAGKMADVGSELVAVAREVRSALEDAARLAARSGVSRQPQNRPEPRPAPRARARREAPPPAERDDELHLKAGARRILETYARHHPMKLTRSQLGTLAGFKITGGTFQTYFSQLKREGLVEELGGESWITDEGFDFLGEVPPAPMTTEEILDRWRSVLKAGARAMLDVLIEEYPDAVAREELADRVEMTASGGTFQTYVATLRRNGLAEVSGETVRASDTLFMEGATT